MTPRTQSYTIGLKYNSPARGGSKAMAVNSGNVQVEDSGADFVEFRRKVREAEVLSAAMEKLLLILDFTGKLSVVVQNGRVLKSGYEEGYFRQRR